MKAAVLGDGAWGSALACLLCANQHQVTLWGPFPDYIEKMRAERVNSRFLPTLSFPPELCLADDLAAAVDGAELLVLAAPTQYVRGVLAKLAPVLGAKPGRIFVNVAKGIETGSLKRLSEIVAEELGEVNYAVLSGPSHAEEVSQGVPTAVTVAARDRHTCETLQKAFMNNRFRVYHSDDIVGLELGGALKNVIAIAAGVVDGMKLGDNPKAALLARGVAEMSRLGKAMGGRPETFAGLSGIGDLIVTCYSGHSRNRFVGEKLGAGMKPDQALALLGMAVAEGVPTTQSAHDTAKRLKVDTPIINELYQVIYHDKPAAQSINDLMSRAAKPEFS